MAADPIPTEVYDTYWRFAAERMATYHRRLRDPVGPWTQDPILRAYRFTNAYRAADRVSQYLIRHVQYRDDRPQAPGEVFFRTLLFKIFNKIETWERIETAFGPVSWQSIDLNRVSKLLEEATYRGARIYSAAYIMPSPNFGHARKHDNHLALLGRMMDEGLPGRLARARSLEESYGAILAFPGLGPFLAFQYAIDLNYSTLTDFPEGDFVVAGPGALDGLSKCFADPRGLSAEDLIYRMVDRQEREFGRLGLEFDYLFGRRLQPIDCQNIFCEISKYARVKHPDVAGVAGRTRIKQGYRPVSRLPEPPMFPPKWGLEVPEMEISATDFPVAAQGQLL
ncbi:MAG: nucleotide kinase domain-containing protein [Allosphingosinicella sp.]